MLKNSTPCIQHRPVLHTPTVNLPQTSHQRGVPSDRAYGAKMVQVRPRWLENPSRRPDPGLRPQESAMNTYNGRARILWVRHPGDATGGYFHEYVKRLGQRSGPPRRRLRDGGKRETPDIIRGFVVDRDGIEPPTHGFSVYTKTRNRLKTQPSAQQIQRFEDLSLAGR